MIRRFLRRLWCLARRHHWQLERVLCRLCQLPHLLAVRCRHCGAAPGGTEAAVANALLSVLNVVRPLTHREKPPPPN